MKKFQLIYAQFLKAPHIRIWWEKL